jgi:sigma-B regulation protein RsbQ
MVFAHGYGCDQDMWRFVAPDFEVDHKVVTFDHVGFGRSDLSAYDPVKYSSLRGYAADVVEIVRELDLSDVVLVGHSVSAMIGVLAYLEAPERFGALVMVGPSARYVDDGDYVGGFSRAAISDLLDALDANHLVWSATMAPLIMGNPDRPELAPEPAGRYVHEHIAGSVFTQLAAIGHCPNLSAPEETTAAIRAFL